MDNEQTPEQAPEAEIGTPADNPIETETSKPTRKGPKKSTDEKGKKKTAENVITPKRLYFFPEHGESVEADTIGRATSIVKRKRKDGDA